MAGATDVAAPAGRDALVIKYVISEEDAKQRIAELKEQRLRVSISVRVLFVRY